MSRMSRCLTRFPISGLGEPNIYHDLGVFYKNVGILLESMMLRENSQGRKRKVVNKLPCKSYIN